MKRGDRVLLTDPAFDPPVYGWFYGAESDPFAAEGTENLWQGRSCHPIPGEPAADWVFAALDRRREP